MKTELWYKKLGYVENPFSIKPAFFNDEVVGYDAEVDSLIKKLAKGEVCFLEAEFGKGKSTIIKYVINEFVNHNKIIHISRNKSDRALDYENLLKEANTSFGKVFGLKAKNVILIVDEVGKINQKDCEQIEKFMKSKNIFSVLFADVSFAKTNLTDSLKKKIDKNLIKLKDLIPNDAVEIVKSRISTEGIISDDLIISIFEKSKRNTRSFLINLEKVFRYSFDNGNQKISSNDLTCL